MAKEHKTTWIARRVQTAIQGGLSRAYESLKVDTDAYLVHLRQAHGLPIESFAQVIGAQVRTLQDQVFHQFGVAEIGSSHQRGDAVGVGPVHIFTEIWSRA